LFSKQNKTEGKRHLVYMLLFRLNGLRAAWAARGAAHCAALQTMHLSAHCVGGSAPAQLYSSLVVVLVFRFSWKLHFDSRGYIKLEIHRTKNYEPGIKL